MTISFYVLLSSIFTSQLSMLHYLEIPGFLVLSYIVILEDKCTSISSACSRTLCAKKMRVSVTGQFALNKNSPTR